MYIFNKYALLVDKNEYLLFQWFGTEILGIH